jgi:hypothetical protein
MDSFDSAGFAVIDLLASQGAVAVVIARQRSVHGS